MSQGFLVKNTTLYSRGNACTHANHQVNTSGQARTSERSGEEFTSQLKKMWHHKFESRISLPSRHTSCTPPASCHAPRSRYDVCQRPSCDPRKPAQVWPASWPTRREHGQPNIVRAFHARREELTPLLLPHLQTIKNDSPTTFLKRDVKMTTGHSAT